MALKRSQVVYISPLTLVTLSACGGGSSDVSNVAAAISQTVSGNVVNGPLNNALVFLDLNSNGILDNSETSVRTDANGAFTVSTTATAFQLIAITDDTTIDTASGEVYSGVTLKAPSDASVITPTTTLMEEGNLSSDEVASVLGLPNGVDPLKFNPYADGVNADDALAVAKLSNQLMTAVKSFAAAAEGAGAAELDAFEAALKSVVDVVKTKSTKTTDAEKILDFTKADDLNLIKAEAVKNAATKSAIDQTAFNALIDDTTTSIKNVNDQIEAISDLKSDETKLIFSQSKKLKDAVKAAVDAEQSASGSGSLNFKDVNLIKGTSKADLIKGGAGDDVVVGGAGDDIIDGGDGDDQIYAGAGNDKVYASLGADYEDGGDGIDTFIVDSVLDYIPAIDLKKKAAYLYGTDPTEENIVNFENIQILSSSNFVLIGDDNANILEGGTGDDIIDGGDGNDILIGCDGADSYVYQKGDGRDVIVGFREGNGDTLSITGYTDEELAAVTTKLVYGGWDDGQVRKELPDGGYIRIYTYESTIVGDRDPDVIKGTTAADHIWGMDGNDTITGLGGNDYLGGGAGNDLIDGGLGKDEISTGDGNDTVVIRKGDGGNTIAEADMISDFSDGSDLIGLNNLNYSDLTIEQGSGDYVSDALISSGSEYLVVIEDINIADLTEADFVAYEIV